jgi:hypothetical protein
LKQTQSLLAHLGDRADHQAFEEDSVET